jgi:asparagine synthase (glutamine-hydrolysing)
MCGFVGFFGTFDPNLLEEASLSIAHRGPDDHGIEIYSSGNLAVAHRRLSIIDLTSAGHQPMLSSDGTVTLVFNGEIYNFKELKNELEGKGVVFRGNSDTEVVLELFRSEGIGMLRRLNGIFALAIFDAKTEELWVARDRFGIKPLYYHVSDRGLLFASEIKAIIPFLEEQSLTIDEKALALFLTYQWLPGSGTFSKEISRIAPGEVLLSRRGQAVQRIIWHQSDQARVPVSAMTASEAVAAVGGALRQAVKRQLVADTPIGAFLSGGVDSSAITALAVREVPDFRCFTIDYEDGRSSGSDLFHAKVVAAHLGVELDVLSMGSFNIADEIDSVVWHMDEPLADPAAISLLYMSRRAQSEGVKVLLSGAGGDDLFSGYRRHKVLRYERIWNWLPSSLRQWAVHGVRHLDEQSDIGRQLKRFSNSFALDGDIGLVSYFISRQRKDLLPLFSIDIRDRLGQTDLAQPLLDHLADLSSTSSRLDRMLALEQRFFLSDHNLNYVDKLSMAAGVEVRVPFLDDDLAELAARIPDHLKQKGRIGKWILKEAVKPYLPLEIVNRSKVGFDGPLRKWILNDLAEMIADRLSEERLRERGIFDPRAVTHLIAENRCGKKVHDHTIFSLLCIEIWCTQFIDNDRSNVHFV